MVSQGASPVPSPTNQAQDFARGLPLRSRPQNGSSSSLPGRAISPHVSRIDRSFAQYARDFGSRLRRRDNASSSNPLPAPRRFLVEVELELVLGKAVHGITVNVADVLSIGTPPEDVTTVSVS